MAAAHSRPARNLSRNKSGSDVQDRGAARVTVDNNRQSIIIPVSVPVIVIMPVSPSVNPSGMAVTAAVNPPMPAVGICLCLINRDGDA